SSYLLMTFVHGKITKPRRTLALGAEVEKLAVRYLETISNKTVNRLSSERILITNVKYCLKYKKRLRRKPYG
ncbi:hypothetical protein KEJ15_07720, partial [Candidatus Bathyarchaeota archaeon]|nr:hypothetical protein [Candidatus Bathyarchaeota archaeon]